VYGFFHEMFGLVPVGEFSQVDNEIKGGIDGKLLRPAQNKILGISVEVFFRKGRRINGVKKLVDVPQVQLDVIGLLSESGKELPKGVPLEFIHARR
jgi:hypothetical protein